MAPAAAVAASRGVTGAFLWLQQQQLQRPEALQERSCGSSSSGCSVRRRCRSVLWLWQQQLQRLEALQVRSVAPAVTLQGTQRAHEER